MWVPDEMLQALKQLKEQNGLKGRQENTMAAKLLIRHANQSQDMQNIINRVHKNYREMEDDLKKNMRRTRK